MLSSVNHQSTTNNTNQSNSSASVQDPNPQLSPTATFLNWLQQLQTQDPQEFAQITGQISTNLKNAANTADESGNTARADALNQLAGQFQSASTGGSLPTASDVQRVAATGGASGSGSAGHHMHGGHGHHHHNAYASSTDQSTDVLSLLFSGQNSQTTVDPDSLFDSTSPAASNTAQP